MEQNRITFQNLQNEHRLTRENIEKQINSLKEENDKLKNRRKGFLGWLLGE